MISFLAIALQIASLTVTLEWDPNDPVEQVQGYRLYQQYNGGPWTKIGETSETTFKIDPIYGYAEYTWYVTAYRYELESDPSEQLGFLWKPPIGIDYMNRLVSGSVFPGGNFLLESSTDLTTWTGLEAKTSESESIQFNVLFDDPMRFFRLKKLPLSSFEAHAMAKMDWGIKVEVTDEGTIETKKTFRRKIWERMRPKRRFLSYDFRKGAELLMQKSKKQDPVIKPPMPSEIKI